MLRHAERWNVEAPDRRHRKTLAPNRWRETLAIGNARAETLATANLAAGNPDHRKCWPPGTLATEMLATDSKHRNLATRAGNRQPRVRQTLATGTLVAQMPVAGGACQRGCWPTDLLGAGIGGVPEVLVAGTV